MIKWDKNIDAQIKRNVERTETAFEDASWQKMNVKLLKHTAEKKRKKKYTYYLLGALGFMALGFFAGQGSLTEKEQQEIVNTDSELSSVQNDSHLSQSLLLLNNEIPTLSNQYLKRDLNSISRKDLLTIRSYVITKSATHGFSTTASREHEITGLKHSYNNNYLHYYPIELPGFEGLYSDGTIDFSVHLLSLKPNYVIKTGTSYTTERKNAIRSNTQRSGNDKPGGSHESGITIDYYTQNTTAHKDVIQPNRQRSGTDKLSGGHESGTAIDYYTQNTTAHEDASQPNRQRSGTDKPSGGRESGTAIDYYTQNTTAHEDVIQPNRQHSGSDKSIGGRESGTAIDYYTQNTTAHEDASQPNRQHSGSDKSIGSAKYSPSINHSTAKGFNKNHQVLNNGFQTSINDPLDKGHTLINGSLFDLGSHDNPYVGRSPIIAESKQTSTDLTLIEINCLPFDSIGSESLAMLSNPNLIEVNTDQYSHKINGEVGEEQKERIDKEAKKLLKKEQRIADKKSREQQKELAEIYDKKLNLIPEYLGVRIGASINNQSPMQWKAEENWNASFFAEYYIGQRLNLELYLIYSRLDYDYEFFVSDAVSPTINAIQKSTTLYINEWGGDINLSYALSGKLRIGLGMHLGKVFSKVEQLQFFDMESTIYETGDAIKLTNISSNLGISYPILRNLNVGIHQYFDLKNLIPDETKHTGTPVTLNRTSISLSYKFNTSNKNKYL